jgi:transposase
MDIRLAHPLKTGAIAEAWIKTDRVDATMLAHLLRTNLLPAAYIAPREIRDIREALRCRASLVAIRVLLKNKIHALLSKNGLSFRTQMSWAKRPSAISRPWSSGTATGSASTVISGWPRP